MLPLSCSSRGIKGCRIWFLAHVWLPLLLRPPPRTTDSGRLGSLQCALHHHNGSTSVAREVAGVDTPFTREEAKAQRGSVLLPRLVQGVMVEPGLTSPSPAGSLGLFRPLRAAYLSRETQVVPAGCSAEMVSPFTEKSHLAAPVGGLVGQDVVLDLRSGRLPGDQSTLSGDVAGCQVCRRVQDCGGEHARSTCPSCSSPIESRLVWL